MSLGPFRRMQLSKAYTLRRVYRACEDGEESDREGILLLCLVNDSWHDTEQGDDGEDDSGVEEESLQETGSGSSEEISKEVRDSCSK